MGRRLAMLIATYEYQDTGLRQLTAPAHDAEAFAAVLRDPAIAGFEVTTLVNQPHHLVGEAIGDFYRERRRDDLTLMYFTGHGLKDDNGRLYLAMTNTRRDGLLFTALSAEQIDQAMEGCASRQKVLILDCCYSGAFPAGRVAKADTAVHALEQFQGRGRTVLTASDATQYSFEGSQLHGEAAQSVFTHYLVAGLRDGSADLDGDGNITLDELYSYVHDRVVDEMPQQRPKKQDNVEGRIVIAQNVNWSLPGYLRNALSSPIATDRLAALDGLAHLHRIGNEFVRQHVTGEIQRLVDDDSRLVSAAAAARLQAIQSPQSLRETTTIHAPDTPQPAGETLPQTTESPATKTPDTPPAPGTAPPIPQAAPGASDGTHDRTRTFTTPGTAPLPPVVSTPGSSSHALAEPPLPRPAQKSPGRRAQWERFGPPAAVFVLVNMSSDFWLTNLGAASSWGFWVWLVRFFVVGLLVFTAVLTPHSKGVTRGVGYVFASFNAIGFGVAATQGAGPTLAHNLPLFNTAIFLSIAAYCYRDIKTRRARSTHDTSDSGEVTHTTSDNRAGDFGN